MARKRKIADAGWPVALGIMLSLAVPARAEIAVSTFASAKAAYGSIATRLEGKAADQLPRLSVAADAESLKALLNLDAVVAGRPHAGSGIPQLLEWSEHSSRILKAYLYARGAANEQEIGTNITEFASEISLASIFNVRLSATMLQSAVAFLASLPEADAKSPARRGGFDQMVDGIHDQVGGLLLMEFSGNPMVPGSDVRAAAALAQDMPIMSPHFRADQRAALVAAFERASSAAKDESIKRDLGNALAALRQ